MTPGLSRRAAVGIDTFGVETPGRHRAARGRPGPKFGFARAKHRLTARLSAGDHHAADAVAVGDESLTELVECEPLADHDARNVTGSFAPSISSGCFVTHQIRHSWTTLNRESG
jgi:hypothetical protein